jgi:hypothetical protein
MAFELKRGKVSPTEGPVSGFCDAGIVKKETTEGRQHTKGKKRKEERGEREERARKGGESCYKLF